MENERMLKSEFLHVLARHLLLNTNFIDSNSLYNGKMGACCFLYHLSEFNDSQIIYEFSNDLLLDIISGLKGNDISYSSGLSGIGFAINYLSLMDFIEIPSEKNIFQEIDQKILRNSLSVDTSVESIGITTYLLDKLQFDFDNQTDDLDILLQSERLAAQVEYIGLNNDIPLYSKNDLFFKKFKHQEDLLNLKVHIDMVYLTTQFLKKVLDREMCQEMSRKYYNVLLDKNTRILSNMIDNLPKLITLDNLVTLNILTKAFFIQLIDGSVSPYDIPLDEKKYCSIADSLINSKIDLNNYSLKFHVDNLAALMNLSSSFGVKGLKHIVSKYLDKLLQHFMKKIYGHSFLDKKNANLGLHGFSGLGLAVLSFLNDFDVKWTKLLLYLSYEE